MEPTGLTAIEYVAGQNRKKRGTKLTGLRRDFGAGPPKEEKKELSL